MKATGLFFLRMRAALARTADGQPVLLLPVVEHEDRDGHRITLNTLTAEWRGDAAAAFYNLHFDELKPGRPLELELDRLRGHQDEWRGHVTRCALAPLSPSWQKAEQQTNTQREAA